MATSERGRGAAGAVLLALASTAAPAAEEQKPEGWAFEPKVSLAAIYSDNVNLAPAGQEDDELVMQLAPSFALKRASERLDVDLDYTFQSLTYQNQSDRDESFHQANAHVLAELVRSRFFVEVNGALTQQIVDPEGAFPPSNIPLTANRTDSVDGEIAPTWRQPLGAIGDLELHYERAAVRYDQPPPGFEEVRLQDLDRQLGLVRLTSPAKRTGTTWGFKYQYDRQEFEDFSEAEFEEASAEIGYKVSGSVRIFASGGEESDYQAHRSNAKLDDPFWEAGMAYVTPDRDDLLVSVGQRTFGTSVKLAWVHTFHAIAGHVRYSQEPSTNAQARFDAFGQPAPVGETGLDRPDDASIFVRKRLESGFSWDTGHSVWTFGLYGEERTDRVDDPNDPLRLGTERSRGANAGWHWKVGSRTDLDFGADWGRSEFGDGRDFDLVHGSASAHYLFGTHTGLRLTLERGSRGGDPRTVTAPGDVANFEENRVSLYIERTFF
jgi:hypothetical protein